MALPSLLPSDLPDPRQLLSRSGPVRSGPTGPLRRDGPVQRGPSDGTVRSNGAPPTGRSGPTGPLRRDGPVQQGPSDGTVRSNRAPPTGRSGPVQQGPSDGTLDDKDACRHNPPLHPNHQSLLGYTQYTHYSQYTPVAFLIKTPVNLLILIIHEQPPSDR
ncbi:unnamed protein product [Boreogadus saida]